MMHLKVSLNIITFRQQSVIQAAKELDAEHKPEFKCHLDSCLQYRPWYNFHIKNNIGWSLSVELTNMSMREWLPRGEEADSFAL